MERNTNQKQTIINYLKSVRNHPSVEEIYNNVKKTLPNISKGTVYRVLNNFVDKGEVLSVESDKTYFDGYTHDHAHLVCKKCNRVFDVEDIKSKIKFPEVVKAGKIDSYEIVFRGTCQKCLATN